MTRKPETISFWRGVLPHWEVVDGQYFVTVRLANSLPRNVAKELRSILADATESDYLQKSRAYFEKMERWLDANRGETWLGRQDVASIVQSTIAKYEELGHWHIMASVIMPNHLHLFFRCGDRSMCRLMRSFKRYTGRACNAVLGTQGQRFWQREWFDHWSRSTFEDDRIMSYIRRNPAKAGLVTADETWPWVT